MIIRKAVITAAGRDQRGLPLQSLVDRDGKEKRALEIVLEEAASAGIEEACVVVAPGDQDAYLKAAGKQAGRVRFAEQAEPRGYGHALATARGFTAGQAFLHLVGDHLHLSRSALRCAQQVADLARAERCAVSAVQATREGMLPYYGAVGGRRVPRRDDLYEIENVMEKPSPSAAEQELLVPGLRAGHYLCLFGIHVLTPAVMDMVAEAAAGAGKVLLSPALARLARTERYLALEVRGTRYDIGMRHGLLMAQLALALDGADRDTVLVQLVELLAQRSREGA
ncbi:MAG: UTP--glucose-1-phosphate uridylyltransferase [Gemmataceae bacterium]|nr:UTP--glucose-1-phosphate uridylyltransferase [Gemmataceae bacterium]